MKQPYASYAENLKNHIRSNVNALLKEPRSFIHYPFIDPGSVYDGNVWDWDTYWSVYAILNLTKYMEPEEEAEMFRRQKEILLQAGFPRK